MRQWRWNRIIVGGPDVPLKERVLDKEGVLASDTGGITGGFLRRRHERKNLAGPPPWRPADTAGDQGTGPGGVDGLCRRFGDL